MTKSISNRIDALMAGPKRLGFTIVYDDANKVWLGRVSSTIWSLLGAPKEERDLERDIAAEGATPSEVLRKLAEMLE